MHRALVRNLMHWRSLHEAREIPDVLVSPIDRREYSLWDVQRVYDARVMLPERQAQAMEYCWYRNMIEPEAAVLMGIGRSNPVGIYATIGMTSLLIASFLGKIPGYEIEVSLVDDPDFWPVIPNPGSQQTPPQVERDRKVSS